jgi:hypothetical protein
MRARYCAVASTESGASIFPGHEIENELGIADQVQPETTDEHIFLREGLVKQFSIRYRRNEVEWLKFPGSVLA